VLYSSEGYKEGRQLQYECLEWGACVICCRFELILRINVVDVYHPISDSIEIIHIIQF
jgi:hypothetical protein